MPRKLHLTLFNGMITPLCWSVRCRARCSGGDMQTSASPLKFRMCPYQVSACAWRALLRRLSYLISSANTVYGPSQHIGVFNNDEHRRSPMSDTAIAWKVSKEVLKACKSGTTTNAMSVKGCWHSLGDSPISAAWRGWGLALRNSLCNLLFDEFYATSAYPYLQSCTHYEYSQAVSRAILIIGPLRVYFYERVLAGYTSSNKNGTPSKFQ